MGNLTTSSDLPLVNNHHIWENLKHAIAASSGFQRWQEEQLEEVSKKDDLEQKVCSYLRETLETLAY
jgi:hypothetical protein